MRRIFILSILLLGFAAGTSAQEEDPFSKEKASIREIKLSNRYYYSDVSAITVLDAKELAVQLLVMYIQQDESGCENIREYVRDSCRFIQLKRVDRPRIFSFISKEAVAQWLLVQENGGKLPGNTPEKEVQAATGADSVKTTPQDTTEIAAKDTAVSTDSIKTDVKDSTLTVAQQRPVRDTSIHVAKDSLPATPRDTARIVSKDTVRITPKDTVRTIPHDTARIMIQDTVKVTVRDTARITVQDTVRVILRDTAKVTVQDTVIRKIEIRTTGNDRLDKIIAMKDIQEIQDFFIAEKKAGRMMFGRMSSAVHPEQCYLVVFSRKGEVKAVLGKGQEKRHNFRTDKKESLEHYPGSPVIWFVLY